MTRTAPRASRPAMPGYGIVPEQEGEGLLPWRWAADRLKAARNYFIATTRADARPHVMVVWGLWIEESFYFSTSRDSRKARNLAVHPQCVICPGDADEAVIVEGTAFEVSDPEALSRFVAEYKSKYDWDLTGRTEPVFVVRPRVVFGQIEETFTASATRWQFD
jgi:nitroimidazol reductase NimA-like FMN-containing flavoprotein (pyridoxamine 5'-phosphate oxidase superfamily)